MAKNVCTPSFLGSLDVAKALNEHPEFYEVLSILLILWGILEGSVKHSQLKLLQKHFELSLVSVRLSLGVKGFD